MPPQVIHFPVQPLRIYGNRPRFKISSSGDPAHIPHGRKNGGVSCAELSAIIPECLGRKTRRRKPGRNPKFLPYFTAFRHRVGDLGRLAFAGRECMSRRSGENIHSGMHPAVAPPVSTGSCYNNSLFDVNFLEYTTSHGIAQHRQHTRTDSPEASGVTQINQMSI